MSTTRDPTWLYVEAASRRLYEAEVAFHAARSSHVDEWIRAAAERLHCAIEAHRLRSRPRHSNSRPKHSHSYSPASLARLEL
jgi:hypothetical protein